MKKKHKKTPNVLYHGTTSALLKSIQKHGLKPDAIHKLVWLTKKKEQAETYALLKVNPFWGESPIIVRVKPKQKEVQLFSKDYFIAKKTISPKRIISIKKLVLR